MDTVYICEESLFSIYACVFDCFIRKETPLFVTTGFAQSSLTYTLHRPEITDEKTKRITDAIGKYGGKYTIKSIEYAFRNGNSNKCEIIFRYIVLLFNNKRDISKMMASSEVIAFTDIVNQVSSEAHRFKGFIRFTQTENNILYAKFEPDNDITQLLMPHFIARLNKQPFVIHDIKRNILGAYNGESSKILTLDSGISISLSRDEKFFVELWKTYYKTVNIKERKNHRLMRNFMPVRYYRNLPEKNPASK